MTVLFGVVLCVLIYLPRLEVTAENDITSLTTITTAQPLENNTITVKIGGNCSELTPPKCQEIIPDKTFASITFDHKQIDEDCIPENIAVNCVTLEEDNLYGWEWVIQNSSTFNSIDGSSNTITVTIEKLSEFTNYSCNGTLTVSDGSQIITSFTINTLQEVSTEPLNLSVTGTTRPKIISVKWEKPEKNPGIFESYQVHVISLGPNHYLPETCSKNTTTDKWGTTTTESFSFENLYADYNYEISVFVQNSAGNGPSTNLTASTIPAASAAPEDFKMDEPILYVDANIFTRNIHWKMPCEPNGNITNYEIYLDGHYITDNQIVNTSTIFVDVTDSKENYSKIIDLQPAFQYTISIRANGENRTGLFYNETFETEDNIPGVPRVDEIIEKGPTFFVVNWDEPERKSGNITSYNIEVIPLMPLYDRDPDRCPFDNQPFSEMLDGDQKSYNFTKGHPYYNYSVSITAYTSKGAGEASLTFAETETSVPEKPADLDFVLLENNTSGLISWIVPCNVNGPLENFNITISGTYSDNSSLHSENTYLEQFESGRYNYSSIVNLSESYKYDAYIRIVLNNGIYGEEANTSVTTPDGYPGPPLIKNATEVDESSFTVTWEQPTEKTGRINYYEINITSLGPLYETHCTVDPYSTIHVEDGSTTTFRFTEAQPYYKYSISIIANTSRGFGDSSEEIFVITNQSIPETVEAIKTSITLDPTEETEKYYAHANISFKEPCHMNGPLINYELNVLGSRPGYDDDKAVVGNITSSFIFPLKPEYHYSFTIKTVNEHFTNTSGSNNFTSPAGVPQFYNGILGLTVNTGSSNAKIILKEEYFNRINGDIQFIALILSDENVTGGDYSRWNNTHWPNPTRDDAIYYQLTKDWWNPLKDTNNTTVDIGIETNCTETHSCNKPLEKNKDYYLIVRIFTNDFYKNSHAIHFKTDDISKLGMILGIIFGLLAFAVFGIAVFCMWKRNIFKLPSFYPRKSSIKTSSTANTAIPIYKFIQYCKNLESNAEKLSEQYSFLAEKTKEAVRMQTTVIAELTENRRKNRYTNILPYDETRVKLLIDEDDEIGSDYINASYIRGYSGKVEYIATQGPLPTTCRDFWKMVLQENVSIIVMVTQFIEQNKEKCHRYFPNNHESMSVGEDMEVKCSMELHFGTYCVRTLQVKKDTTQATVTHMQYLDWPDFNVPKGTDNMLQFCYQLRERLKLEGGYVIIHCSAGVGRTGTLIATDILLQNLIAGKNIDVFNTVLELRKQRTHMVQTQKQYMYIHDLVKDYLDQSNSSGLNENTEPLYENLSVLKVKTDDDNLIAKDKETESQF